MARSVLGVLLSTVIMGFYGCDVFQNDPLKDVVYDPTLVSIQIDHPGFPNIPKHADNPVTEEGIALGRKLYYDSRLHENSEHSCATCHQQQNAFTSDKSVLTHINLGFDNVFLWKGDKQGTLEDIMLFEVDEFFNADMSKLSVDEDYRRMFKQAFGIEKIESQYAAYALAQFLKTLNSYNSKYDQYLRNEIDLTDAEKRGELIFFSEIGDCFHCHSAPLFKDNLLHNNGLDSDYKTDEDYGHYRISGIAADKGKFKTPTLRNIELTAPYMHDGRFETLEEVIVYYSYGVNNVANIDPLMKQAYKGGIALEPDDILALVAFLKTLTDYDVIENKDFGPIE
ncbi:MAG: cytochrome-c peroxidase [Bacteroidia bacterium]